jgi:uncharacterized protein (TIGR02611 family)
MKLLRRIVIALVGGAVLLIGIVMIVLPAPAILVIPAGLAILAIEFVWARQCLHKIRQYIAEKKNKSFDRATPLLEPVSLPKVSVTEEFPARPAIHRQAQDD